MAGFKDKSVVFLVILLLVSGALIAIQGPNWGIDIEGGSRIMIRVEATQASILLESPTSDRVNEILSQIEEEFNVPPPRILEDYEDGLLRIEIGRRITEDMLSPLIGEGDSIRDITSGVTDITRDDLIDAFRARVDPYGTLGAHFRSIGDEYIRFEVALDLDEARVLLGEVGGLEIFIGDNLVIRGEHIRRVRSWDYDARDDVYYVPFTFTDEGAERFANATIGKAGHPGVIYMDRPSDSVLLFHEDFISELKSSVERDPRLEDLEYMENENRFRIFTSRSSPGEEIFFTVQMDALKINRDEIPSNTKNYLINNLGRLTNVTYLGELDYLNDNLLYNDDYLIIQDNDKIPIDNLSKLHMEPTFEWFKRATGIRSFPTISPEVAGNIDAARDGLRITTGTMEDARDIRTLLAQRLPAEVKIESGEEIDPRLGAGFLSEALRAGIIALIVVGAIIYIRYRKFKIAIPIMFTLLCEVTITLGISSILPETLLTMGIAEIGGLIAVIGFGVDHQIMITDEVLHGGSLRSGGRLPLDRRTKRAYSIIFAAVATTIAAMAALATVGLGAMRGFAIITIIGVSISVLITRPAYAAIIGALLERE